MHIVFMYINMYKILNLFCEDIYCVYIYTHNIDNVSKHLYLNYM